MHAINTAALRGHTFSGVAARLLQKLVHYKSALDYTIYYTMNDYIHFAEGLHLVLFIIYVFKCHFIFYH